MMSQRTVRDLFWFPMFDQLDIAHARGRTQVIHDRVRFIETLRGKNVLVGDAFVLIGRPLPVTVKPDVMFPRDFSQSLVIRHYRLLSLLCHSEPSEESLISGFFTVFRVKSRRSEMFRFAQHDKLQIPSGSLFAFDGFEQRLEITFATTLCAFALNDLKKQRRSILDRFCEDLQQITFIIAIDENA